MSENLGLYKYLWPGSVCTELIEETGRLPGLILACKNI